MDILEWKLGVACLVMELELEMEMEHREMEMATCSRSWDVLEREGH